VPLSRFGPDGTDATQFERLSSVAVDQQSGSVYVLDGAAEALLKFGPGGEAVAFGGANPQISGNRIEGIIPYTDLATTYRAVAQVAVDPSSHTVYVTEEHGVRAFNPEGDPVEFTAGPGAGTNELPGFGELYGVAVDENGSIYAIDGTGSLSVFASTGAPLTTVAVTTPLNLAVGAGGVVYVVAEGGEAVRSLVPSSFPITEGTTYAVQSFVNSTLFYRIASITVDPSTSHVYLLENGDSISYIREYDQSGTLVGSIGEPGTESEEFALRKSAIGLAVLGTPADIGSGEAVKLYAGDMDESTAQVVLFGSKIIIGAPSVSDLRVTGVTADSAVLQASVNPDTGNTTYRFEYGLEDCSIAECISVPAGGAEIGSGTEDIAVSQTLSGLSPATTYHYRIVAENELGPPSEATGTFKTQANGLGFELSDNRVWEMVSPPEKHGGAVIGSLNGLIQAAADGNGLSYMSRGSIELDPDGNRNFESSQIVAKRVGGGEWRSKDITSANDRSIPLSEGHQSEFKLFSPDLRAGMLEPREGAHLSPLATERTPYLREEGEPPLYTPLVTGAEGIANVPVGREFGGNSDAALGPVRITGANQDLSYIVLSSTVSLIEDPNAPDALYLWHAGDLEPVSILPDSEGGTMPEPVQLGSGPGSVRNAVSEDGSRVFWSPGNYGSGSNLLEGLYLRATSSDETVRLDTVQGGTGEGEVRPLFQGANPSGTIVYFSDSQRLTSDASPAGFDLYRCEIPAGNAAGGCSTLTNLSGPATSGGESAEVLWLAQGISEAGSRLYFVAEGILSANQNEFGDGAVAGEPNLYFWEEGAAPRFVATLSKEDDPDWGGRFKTASELSTGVSPDGQYLAFMSQRELTGQPNEDTVTGKPVEHVFVYNAVSDALQCVSCNPTGAASPGQISEGYAQLVDSRRQWEGHRISGVLPPPTVNDGGGPSLYRSRIVFDSGRVFFHALDGLVSADSNNQWDVYQFEPLGLGTCAASSGGSAVTRSGGGCVSLVSSGNATEESAFLDASASGDDAFFLSSARLSVLDQDNQLDVYDARVGGTALESQPPSECVGEACRSSSTSPGFGAPNSSSFVGKGNLHTGKKCPKGKKKVHKNGKVRCVPRHKNKHSKSQKRHGQGRTKGRVSR